MRGPLHTQLKLKITLAYLYYPALEWWVLYSLLPSLCRFRDAGFATLALEVWRWDWLLLACRVCSVCVALCFVWIFD